MIIREGETKDAESIRSLLKSLQEEELDVITRKDGLPSIEEEREWVGSHAGSSSALFVCDVNGDVVGMINGSVFSPKDHHGQYRL